MVRPGWGIGALIAILLSFAAYLFGLLTVEQTASTILLLVGLWTIVVAFLGDSKDRTYYSGWGVVLAVLSLFAFIPFYYTVGLILIAVVALIILSVYAGRAPKAYAAATNPPRPAGETPAAKN